MFTIQNTGSNYLAKIVKLGPPRKHNNADKLLCHSICFNNVITDLSYKENDLVVYFPLETQINKDLISYFNGFSKSELNKDTKVRGFFDNNGRVRAVKLRGEPSAGFIIKLELLIDWLVFSIGKDVLSVEAKDGMDFDSYDDVLICQKYTIPVRNSQVNKEKKKVKRESKIVEGQFRVSEDTAALKRNIDKINPDDLITISYKLHGTNASLGRVLCKRKLTLIEKISRFFGAKIEESYYDVIWASRTVIKNQFADKVSSSYYKEDVWEVNANKYKERIENGITLYAEIVGQLPSGGHIQKNYDYSLPPGQSEMFVYRITYTKPDGSIIEFTTPQIQRYCQKYQLNTVPIFYYGRAKDWNTYLEVESHWHENFLAELIKIYNEKDCYMCKNKVAEEGVVLTKEASFFEAYKLKSFRFLERETELLDKGEENIEDNQTQEE